MLAMKSSSAVTFQYSHTAQATSAEMWCSMKPERMGIFSPPGPLPNGGVVSAPVSADSQGKSAPRWPMVRAFCRAPGRLR